MSIRALVWAFEQKCQSPAEKLVLIKLADNANDDGMCWPSQTYLAEHCEMTRQTACGHCKALEQKGFVKIVRNFEKPNTYVLNMGGVVKPADKGLSSRPTPPVGQPDREPSLNRHKEPKNQRPTGRAHLSDSLKIAADKIYRIDEKKFDRLVVWIKQAQKYNYSEDCIILTLERFLPYAETVDSWYPYLDKLIAKAKADISSREHLDQHRERLAEDRATARLLGLGDFGNA